MCISILGKCKLQFLFTIIAFILEGEKKDCQAVPFFIIKSIYTNKSLLIVSYICSAYNSLKVVSEVGPLFVIEGGELMSDFELITVIIGILTLVISFGALIALICLTKSKQPSVTMRNQLNRKAISQIIHFLRCA